MKTYFRILAVLSLLGFAAVVIYIISTFRYMSGYELAGGIIALVLFILLGPAEGLLFAHVARLTEQVEELKEQVEENKKLVLEGNIKFRYFKGFEVMQDIDALIDGKPIVAGLTGVITEEDDHAYKATITLDGKKKNIAFSKKEKRIHIFEFVKALEEVKTPNNKVIKANKVGQIIDKRDNGECVVQFVLDNDERIELIIDESLIYRK